MYDDNYRSRFGKVPIASYADIITPDCHSLYLQNSDGDFVFTQLHNHKDFEILFIKSGTAHFTVDSVPIEAQSGDALLFNPYELHYGVASNKNLPFSFYCFTFDLSMLCGGLSHPAADMCRSLWNGHTKFDNLISGCNEFVRIFAKLEDAFEKNNTSWEYYVCAHIFELFGFLTASGFLHNVGSVSKDKIFVRNVQKYIDNNFTENITSADAASELSYNNSYFCRLFRKNFGQTFGEYLNFHRVNHAKKLLSGGSSVSEAALASGYNNISYFIKIFKKYNIGNPSDYIRRQNNLF